MRIDPILTSLEESRLARLVPRGLMRVAQRFWARLRRMWRRSLQFRVVGITLVLSGALVAGFGFSVAYFITGKVLDAKKTRSTETVLNGAAYTATQVNSIPQSDDPALLNAVQSVVAVLTNPNAGPGVGGTVDVVILRSGSALNLPADRVARPHPGAFDVMTSAKLSRLRAAVGGSTTPDRLFGQYATVAPAGELKTYFIVGTAVPTGGGTLELYYLFPLDSEQFLANGIAIVVSGTGVALVALMVLLAFMVTRLVVKPVRVAARTAQRLSAGLLDQRMEVRGEDDLARLAAAFNQMAANLQRQIVRLEEMSRLQRRFTSDVSHELRTPLTTVRMATDMIFSVREEFDPAVARSAELLQAELDRFEDLLTDLLEISRFDAGFAALDSEPSDLVPVVRRVGDRLSPLAERCGVELQFDLPDVSVIAEVDARRVERILRNLLGNAVEHGEGRPVRVTLATDESAVAVTVRDHGVGLRSGEEKLVFNRFWRADPSRARQTGGTGLGLSISLEDARLHGGWLEAWGAPGQGAQFRLTLPARAGDRLVSSPLRLVPDDARADEAQAGEAALTGGAS